MSLTKFDLTKLKAEIKAEGNLFRFIRVSKEDGAESPATEMQVRRGLQNSVKDIDLALAQIQDGATLEGSFFQYRLAEPKSKHGRALRNYHAEMELRNEEAQRPSLYFPEVSDARKLVTDAHEISLVLGLISPRGVVNVGSLFVERNGKEIVSVFACDSKNPWSAARVRRLFPLTAAVKQAADVLAVFGAPPVFDTVGFIMAYEGGELSPEEVFAGFQELINSGLAWQLQGHYGRAAAALIDAGYCQRAPDGAK